MPKASRMDAQFIESTLAIVVALNGLGLVTYRMRNPLGAQGYFQETVLVSFLY